MLPGHHPPLPPRPLPRWALLLVLVAAGGGLAAARSELETALQSIDAAFHAGDAGRLAPVLPERAKVLIELESFSRRGAYYSSEQALLVFEQVFTDFKTTRFQLDRRRASVEGSHLFYVPAIWTGESRSGGTRDVRVQFLLVLEDGAGYRIREIKEVR